MERDSKAYASLTNIRIGRFSGGGSTQLASTQLAQQQEMGSVQLASTQLSQRQENGSVAPTELVRQRDAEALDSMEMISRDEARVRKYIGATLWLTALMSFLFCGPRLVPAGAWVLWSAAGVVIHRMGIESQ